MNILDTLSSTEQKLHNSEKIKIYLCGVTVYDESHIGHARTIIVFDVLRKYLENKNIQVELIQNFTDVDDKIINKAKEENVSAQEISNRYIENYFRDFDKLNIKHATNYPKATEHIEDIIEFIKKLIDKEIAYVSDNGVYFSVSKFPEYGKLSKKKIDELKSGSRIQVDETKKDPLDFAVWKFSDVEPVWESPWGKGRPGWHIECSVMSMKYLGGNFDIHGGGRDLIFPHHENEIAQTEALTKKTFSTYWVHNNFIRFGDEKMSKSLGNVIKARDYMKQYSPEILKFIILSVHYRSELNIDSKQSHQAISRLARIYYALKRAKELSNDANQTADDSFNSHLLSIRESIDKALNDDFNTPKVFASLFESVRLFNTEIATKKTKDPMLKGNAFQFLLLFKTYGDLFSLFNETPSTFLKELDMILIKERNIDIEYIESQILLRKKARESKDFNLSDSIRDNLKKMTVLIQDTPQGTSWEIDKTQ